MAMLVPHWSSLSLRKFIKYPSWLSELILIDSAGINDIFAEYDFPLGWMYVVVTQMCCLYAYPKKLCLSYRISEFICRESIPPISRINRFCVIILIKSNQNHLILLKFDENQSITVKTAQIQLILLEFNTIWLESVISNRINQNQTNISILHLWFFGCKQIDSDVRMLCIVRKHNELIFSLVLTQNNCMYT